MKKKNKQKIKKRTNEKRSEQMKREPRITCTKTKFIK